MDGLGLYPWFGALVFKALQVLASTILEALSTHVATRVYHNRRLEKSAHEGVDEQWKVPENPVNALGFAWARQTLPRPIRAFLYRRANDCKRR